MQLTQNSQYCSFSWGSWALYAESLGADLGCYRDDKQRLDFLASEMLRARRLVVDPGLHVEGWTRGSKLPACNQFNLF